MKEIISFLIAGLISVISVIIFTYFNMSDFHKGWFSGVIFIVVNRELSKGFSKKIV